MKSSMFLSAAAVAMLAPAALHAQIAPAPKGSDTVTTRKGDTITVRRDTLAARRDTVTTRAYGGAVDFGYSPYPHYGLQADFGGTSRWGFGARFETGVTRLLPAEPQYRLIGSFDYFPGGSSNNWEINANAINLFPVRNVRANSYLGAGLNIAHNSPNVGASNTNLGLNLLGGIRLAGAQSPFVEARLEIGGGSQFLITAGYNFK